jgi:hypothetical protein
MTWVRLVLVLLCAGCADRSATGPSEPSPWLGTWVGTLDNAVTGPGTLRLDIRSDSLLGSGQVLSGTWSTRFSRVGFDDGGALDGARGGRQVLLTLTSANTAGCPPPAGGSPPPQFAVMIEGVPPAPAGTYVMTRCDGASATGTVDMRRQ